MKLTDISFEDFNLPLKTPIVIGANTLRSRTGILIKLTSNTHSGIGEISPLPGLHQETVEEVKNQLKRIVDGLLDIEIYPIALLNDLSLFPSVKFGLEAAIVDLFFQVEGVDLLSDWFGNQPVKTYNSSLITLYNENWRIQLAEALKDHRHTLKVKVGREELQIEIEKIKQIQSQLPSQATIRFDANQEWTVFECLSFLEQLKAHDIEYEYIEEPLRDLSQYKELFRVSNIRIALDESVMEYLDSDSYFSQIVALVVKPTNYGGVLDFLQLVRLSKAKGNPRIVISDTFQSSVGRSFLTKLASYFPDVAHGLGTDRYF